MRNHWMKNEDLIEMDWVNLSWVFEEGFANSSTLTQSSKRLYKLYKLDYHLIETTDSHEEKLQ